MVIIFMGITVNIILPKFCYCTLLYCYVVLLQWNTIQGTSMEQAKTDLIEQLCEALLKMETISDAKAFLKDICTPKELQDLSERWNVCLLLNDKKSYRAISDETGISLTTITRVARFLKNEPYKGYQMALAKIKSSNTRRQERE